MIEKRKLQSMNVYISNFKNLKNEEIEVRLTDSMTSDSQTYSLTLGNQPVVIEVEEQDGLFTPILTRACTVEIVASTPYFNLYSSKWNDTTIKVTNKSTNELLFDGFVTPCLYSQNFVNDADTISLECIDKLASLENVEYTPVDDHEQIVSVIEILQHIFSNVGITTLYWQNTIVNTDTQISTLESFKLNEHNFCEDIDKGTYWSCRQVLYEICKFFGLTAFYSSQDTVVMYDISSYKVYDSANWFGTNNFTRVTFSSGGLTGYALEAQNLNVETFYITKDEIYGNDAQISLDDVFKRVSVLASTNVDEDSSDDSGENDEDLYASDGVIAKWVTYFYGEESVYDSAVYVKVVKLKNWEQHIWAHAGGNGPLYELSAPGSSDDVVGKDFKHLRWMDGLHRENSVFHWANSMYGALIKTMQINFKEDVTGDFTSCLALGFGMVGTEYYHNPGSNGSKKQRNFWIEMMKQYNANAGQYEVLKYTSKKSRVWQNQNVANNSDDDAYYILFNGVVRMTAIAANGMIRNSLQEMSDTNYPMIYDSEKVFWRKKIEDKFNDDDGKQIWYNAPNLRKLLEIFENRWPEDWDLIRKLTDFGFPVIAYKLKIGDKWWNSETKQWQTTSVVSWMNVGMKNLYVEDDMEISNNIDFAQGIEESGWGIPVRNSDNLVGQMELTLMNPAFPVIPDAIYENHYHEALLPCCLLIKDFKIDYLEVLEDGYWWKEEEDVTNPEEEDKTKDRSEDDTEYYYQIDDNFQNEFSPWEVKINTQVLEKDPSYSSVIYDNGEQAGYLQKVLNACSSNSDYKFAEEWLVEKLGKHYRSPKKRLEMTISDFVDPMRPIIYRTASKDRCSQLSQSWNVRTGQNTISFCEIE